MKSSIFIAGASAALAFAMPADKREIHTQVDVVYEWDTVTVTAGSEPTPAPVAPAAKQAFYAAGSQPKAQQKQNYPVQKAPEPDVVVVTVTADEPKPTTTQAPPPPPPATTPEVEVVTVTEGAPEPSTYQVAPAPAPPAASPSTQAAPAPVASDYPTPNRPVSANNMQTAAVNSHNMHRSNHSAPEAQWNSRIAGYAANTAATCKYAHDMSQGDADYGQNIAMWGLSSGAEKLGDVGAINMAIHDMWYNGELGLFLPSFYGESSPDMSNFEKWGHFSQLVWKESTGVGCQAQFCPKGTLNDGMDTWFMVCNYFPAGNVGGAYGKNVLKPLGKAKVAA
ncbi:hypothetical protein PG990_013366 [Apiospora arundinis]|jgi:uncharacterized protein YkwD|uniref:Scp-like extracellular protein n=1 Tax=Apiospora arundinis TaxID=335852 RepID=A0ABR2HT57_9PEZI